MNDLATYIALVQRKRDLTAQAKELGEQADALEAKLLEEWADAGRQSVTEGGYHVYLSGVRYAPPRDEDRARAVQALLANGMGDMLTYNGRTLGSWITEREKLEEEVPAWLAEVVNLDKTWSLNVRKAQGATDNASNE